MSSGHKLKREKLRGREGKSRKEKGRQILQNGENIQLNVVTKEEEKI